MKSQLGRPWTALLVPCVFVLVGCGETSETIAPPATPDTTPPSVPTDVTLYDRPDYLEVTWTPNAEVDLDGYQVIRSTDNGATWEPASASTLETNSFQSGKFLVVQYRVSAVDDAANESAYSGPVGYRAPNRDPKIPTAPEEPRI